MRRKYWTYKYDISDEIVDEVEQEVGMGCGAWDMVDPKEIILAVVKIYEKNQPNEKYDYYR